MITVRVELSDDHYESLAVEARRLKQPLERVLAQQVSAARQVPTTGHYVIASGEDLQILEEILGGGSVLNSHDLRKKVERLAGLSFFHIRLPFTPNQLEALRDKAERQGMTVEQLVARTAPRVYEQFFDLVARV